MTSEKSISNDSLYGERVILGSELICFPNPKIGRPYQISITFPEFTCLCPFSGYPDFASIRLKYEPNQKVLELKSMKLYINSYRNQRISHEAVANQILDEMVRVSEPLWMKLEADFNPRGNVHTIISVSHGLKQTL